jgi:hypothetical protein
MMEYDIKTGDNPGRGSNIGPSLHVRQTGSRTFEISRPGGALYRILPCPNCGVLAGYNVRTMRTPALPNTLFSINVGQLDGQWCSRDEANRLCCVGGPHSRKACELPARFVRLDSVGQPRGFCTRHVI